MVRLNNQLASALRLPTTIKNSIVKNQSSTVFVFPNTGKPDEDYADHEIKLFNSAEHGPTARMSNLIKGLR
jgi:hypothetical protein